MSIIRYKNVDWSVPFLFNNQKFLVNVISYLAQADIESPIRRAYGYMTNTWNGQEHGMQRFRDVGNALKEMAHLNVTSEICFTNYHLEEEHLKDRFCNELLDYGVAMQAEFLVSSDLLYNHIKSRYPNAKVSCSEVKALYEMEAGKEKEFYTRIYDKYEKITLSPHYVKRGFLQDSYEDVSKFEVIANHTCLESCQFFKEHNESVENFELKRGEEINYYLQCPKRETTIMDGVSKTLVLSKSELDSVVFDKGITKLRMYGFNFQPILFPEMFSTYVFETMGNYQHLGFFVDRSVIMQEGVRF